MYCNYRSMYIRTYIHACMHTYIHIYIYIYVIHILYICCSYKPSDLSWGVLEPAFGVRLLPSHEDAGLS